MITHRNEELSHKLYKYVFSTELSHKIYYSLMIVVKTFEISLEG